MSSDTEGIRSVCIASRGRPETLDRTLATWAETLAPFGRRPELFVFEAVPPAEARYGEILARRTNAFAAGVWHATDADVATFGEEMARAGAPREEVAFALGDMAGAFPPSVSSAGLAYGAGRNAHLFHGVGDLLFVSDDDALCRMVPSPDPLPGLELYSGIGRTYRGYDPQEFYYFRDRADALAFSKVEVRDPLAAHERLLGRRIREIVAREPEVANRCLDPELQIKMEAEGVVRITTFGLTGDAGWNFPTWLLVREGESFRRLAGDEAAYKIAMHSRELMRVVRRPTIHEGRVLQGTVMALDHRTPLPPFFPVMRAEDIVYRMTLRLGHDSAFFAHLPWGFIHDRPNPISWEPGAGIRTAAIVRTADIIVQCLLSCPAEAAGEPLAALGSHLIELARLPRLGFDEFVIGRLKDQKERLIAHMEERLRADAADHPWWARDVSDYIQTYRRASVGPEYGQPVDLVAAGVPAQEALGVVQVLLERFGRLLIAWPAIMACAARLRARGIRLGRRLGDDPRRI